MRIPLKYILLAAFCDGALATGAVAATYRTQDFDAAQPAGVWSSVALSGAQCDQDTGQLPDPGVPLLNTTGRKVAGNSPVPFVAKPTVHLVSTNSSGLYQVNKMYLILHPGPTGCVAMKFIAPVSGSYVLDGLFGGAQSSLSPVSVFVSIRKSLVDSPVNYIVSQTRLSTYSAQNGQINVPFSATTSLSAGDSVYFMVSKNSTYWNAYTLLDATITGPNREAPSDVAPRRILRPPPQTGQ